MKRGVDFGYVVENGVIVVDRVEAKVVKEIFRMFMNGIEISKISKHLMQTSCQNDVKHKLSYEKVNKILRNSNYIGKGLYALIISSEEFNEVELLLRKHDSKVLDKKMKSRSSEFIEGKIICKECGAKYNAYNIADQPTVKSMKCSRYRVKKKRTCNSPIIEDTKILEGMKKIIEELCTGVRSIQYQKPKVYVNDDCIKELNTNISRKEEEQSIDEVYIDLIYKKAEIIHKHSLVYDDSYELRMQEALKLYSGELNKKIIDVFIKEIIVLSDSKIQCELLNGKRECVSI